MSERTFEPMTKAEVVAAQRAWARCVTEQDVDGLLDLYDFGSPDEPVLFKPTLADVIRLDRQGARAYFVGGDADYPQDSGFLKRGWTKVEFQSAVGPLLKAGVLISLHHSSLTWFPPVDACSRQRRSRRGPSRRRQRLRGAA